MLTVIPAIALYIFILGLAKLEFGPDRILGWDTLVYAFSAQETARLGLSALMAEWGHPNVYVLLLTGVSVTVQDTSLAANLLPIALVGTLSLGTGLLTSKLGGRWAIVLAVLLTATSFATFRLFIDLHRALLAFAGVTLLLYLNAPQSLSKTRPGLAASFSFLLLFLVAFSEFEIYLLFMVVVVLSLVLTRATFGGILLAVGKSLVPGILFLLINPDALGIFAGLAGAPATGVVQALPFDLASLYLLTLVALPLAVVGAVFIIERWKAEHGGPGLLLVLWSGILLLVLSVYGVLTGTISLFRPLLLLHIPIFVAVGVERSINQWISKPEKSLGPTVSREKRKPGPSRASAHVAFAVIASSLILLTGIQTIQNRSMFLLPIVDEELYSRLLESSEFIEAGWPPPIYLVMNKSRLQFLPPIRLELGLRNGPTALYYGDINFLPWNVAPDRTDPSVRSPRSTFLSVDHEFRRMIRMLEPGPFGSLSHPIVVIQPELFPRSLPDSFEQFQVREGLYVIPPNTLSKESFLRWEILAEEDSFGLGSAYRVARSWSLSGSVVELYATTGAYQLSFPHYFPVTGEYTIAIHLFDFPSTDFNSTTPLSPLQVLIGGIVIDTLTYGTSQVIWWNVTVQLIGGLRTITLRTSTPDLPFRMSLDMIVVAAKGS